MGALGTALQTLLDHVVDGYTEAGVTDAPTRAYISPGEPPADCELVALWGVPQLKERNANSNPALQRCSIIPVAYIQIVSWLCVPTGDGKNPPTEAALTEAALRIADHAWAVWSHLAHLISHGDLHPDLPCAGAQLLNATQIINEEGAYAGWQIPLYVDLNPFRTDPAS